MPCKSKKIKYLPIILFISIFLLFVIIVKAGESQYELVESQLLQNNYFDAWEGGKPCRVNQSFTAPRDMLLSRWDLVYENQNAPDGDCWLNLYIDSSDEFLGSSNSISCDSTTPSDYYFRFDSIPLSNGEVYKISLCGDGTTGSVRVQDYISSDEYSGGFLEPTFFGYDFKFLYYEDNRTPDERISEDRRFDNAYNINFATPNRKELINLTCSDIDGSDNCAGGYRVADIDNNTINFTLLNASGGSQNPIKMYFIAPNTTYDMIVYYNNNTDTGRGNLTFITYYEDFEDGIAPRNDGWTDCAYNIMSPNPTNEATGGSPFRYGTRYMKVAGDSGSASVYGAVQQDTNLYNVSDYGKKYWIYMDGAFDVRGNAQYEYGYCVNGNDFSSWTANEEDDILATDNSNVIYSPYVAGDWYRMKMKIDLSSSPSTITYTINNTHTTTSSAGTTDYSKVMILTYGIDAEHTGFVDNYIISEEEFDTQQSMNTVLLSNITFINTPPPEAGWTTPATDPDADNINTTFDWDSVVDADADPVTYLLYMNLTGADYELLFNGSSTFYLVNFTVESDYKYRVDTYDGEDTTTGSERIFTFDNTEPVLQIFDPVNNTVYQQNLENITVNLECTDDNLYILNYTFYNSSQILNSIQNATPDGRYLTITDGIDISNYEDGNYQFKTECSDSHTNNNIPDYGVNYEGDSIIYDVGGNIVKITLELASNQINSISTVKEDDRYTFEFDVDPSELGGFPNARYNFWFRIESQLPIDYLSESNYDAHFITGNNWIDLENDDEGAMYTVVKVSDYVYRIKVLTNNLNFHSIGGLNIVEQIFDFTLDACDPIYNLVDTSDECFINDTGTRTFTYSDSICGFPDIINSTNIVYCNFCTPELGVNVFCLDIGECGVDYIQVCDDLNNSCYNQTGLESDQYTYAEGCVGAYGAFETGEIIIDLIIIIFIGILSFGALIGLILIIRWVVSKIRIKLET